jgi:hypothetical protein
MTAGAQEGERGVVSGQGVADFSHFTSAEEFAGISRIEGVGAVIVPESMAAAYAAIPSSGVGATVYVPQGSHVRLHTGALSVSGDGIGAPEDVLVVIGLLLITSPVTGPLPSRISVIGSVMAPRGSEGQLGHVLGGGVGGVLYYHYVEGQDFKMLSGQVKLSGAMLANPAGRPDDLLIAAGQVVVTSPVTTVGFSEVIIAGQLAGPAGSRDMLEPRVQAQGQSGWYRSPDPRIFVEDARLGPDYFRLLDRPVSLVVFGDLAIAPGVTEAMLREKVSDVVLFGDITAPAGLVPVLQVLATDAFGTIQAGDGPGS